MVSLFFKKRIRRYIKRKMAKKKIENNKQSIFVRGMEIAEDAVYEVVPKRPDKSAPDLYVKLGSEKHLNPNISNLVYFVAKDDYWDTGFYSTSEVFRDMGLRPEEAEIKSEEYKKFIVEPLLNFDKRYEKLLEPSTTNTFLDDLPCNLFTGRQFNTKDPRQRLELYLAIVSGHIAPSGYRTKAEKEEGLLDENHSAYVFAQYALEAKEKVKSIEEKRTSLKVTATGEFYTLLNSNKKLLVSLLNYLGVNASMEETNGSLTTRTALWLEDIDNCESFIETIEESKDSPAFAEELKIMDVLRNERGMLLLDKAGREYMLLGKYLGTTEKQIARQISRDPELLQEFYSKTSKK